ncbi:MAG: TOMM precursor leader peptide-binding protein [Mycobacteriales bacterium]
MPAVGFRRHLRADVVAGDAVYLFSERDVTALQGSGIETLAPLLDGSRDLPGLLREASLRMPAELARALIAKLAEANLIGLRSPDEPADSAAAAYWDALGLDPATVTPTGRVVRVLTVGDIDPEPAVAALRVAGLDPTPALPVPGDGAELSVVLCEDYLADRLAEVDRCHRAAGAPWLLAKPAGGRVWIGPVFEPGGPCWHCLATRLWGSRQAEAHVQAALGRAGHAPRPATSLPPLGAAAVHLVVLEAAKWLAGHRYPGQRSIWTLDSVDLRGRHHEVRARPQCPECGDPELVRAQADRPVVLAPSTPPPAGAADILGRYGHLVSPVTGVVREIQRDARGPAMVHAFRSGPVQALRARDLDGLRRAVAMQNGGTGPTAEQGEASALCEALERHSSAWQGEEQRIHGSYRELAGVAVHPDSCQLYSERQFAERDRWNREHGDFQYVCAPFDETVRTSWSPVWSLTQRRRRLLPTQMLYFGAPGDAGPVMVRADSNGNAAGADLTDAVLRGLLELVERDAVALWWYNRTRQPALDLDAFADVRLRELREMYGTLRREVWALDLTSDVGVPAVVALSRRVDQPREEILFGFGADLDPRVALRRAVNEMNQLLPSVVEPGEGDREGEDTDAAHWWRTATVANQPYLLPDPDPRPRVPADFGPPTPADRLLQVERIRARIEELGLEVLVLDLTRPDIGLPVAKVVVPGLRPFWARFAPGRLYEVPVRLGRRAEPTPYHELNPIPMFL